MTWELALGLVGTALFWMAAISLARWHTQKMSGSKQSPVMDFLWGAFTLPFKAMFIIILLAAVAGTLVLIGMLLGIR